MAGLARRLGERPFAPQGRAARHLYDRRSLTYSNTFASAGTRAAIRAIEWATARPAILARVRAFERRGAAGEPQTGQAFWRAALDVMGIEVRTPPEQVARIPPLGRWCLWPTIRTASWMAWCWPRSSGAFARTTAS